MARQHLETGCDASSVFLTRGQDRLWPDRFDSEMRLCAYREKPTSMYYVSMGIYMLQREAVRPCIGNGEYLAALTAAENEGGKMTFDAFMTNASGSILDGPTTSPWRKVCSRTSRLVPGRMNTCDERSLLVPGISWGSSGA